MTNTTIYRVMVFNAIFNNISAISWCYIKYSGYNAASPFRNLQKMSMVYKKRVTVHGQHFRIITWQPRSRRTL